MRANLLYRHRVGASVLGALLSAALHCAAAEPMDEPIKPVPIDLRLDPRKVALGEKLFHDKRLSRDNSLSCASCHNLARGGVDGLPTSVGIGGAKGPINAPTVFNSGLNFRQFWDGRAASLEEQAAGPVHNPKEMGSSWPEVLGKLAQDAGVVAQVKALYPDGLQAKNLQDSIATFERSLHTPNARFDKYLRGDRSAISADELKGYELFKKYGCVACHQGVAVGGNMYQTFGVMGDYFARRGNVTAADLGRYNVTRNEADRHVFKVPSLRNVALTAPYFHDGSARTLAEAVAVMFRVQLGRAASAQDQERIVMFLRTLTGEYKGRPLDQAEISAAQ
ncbi:cytochrome-c peroxidase [Ideonella sp. A 288]|uniref:cytochrome-c peroxidase n=1 Tax=Ideonella sp. A 288 TaxID=1962181 RepID=UPI000B4AE478|nr:cytochrome-c peroxidase [Ideonella sp. A 288]